MGERGCYIAGLSQRDICFTLWRGTTYIIHPLLHLSTLKRNILNVLSTSCKLVILLLMNNSYLPTNSDKKRKLTEQQQSFLAALATSAKGNINIALQEAGYADSSKSNVIDTLKDEIIDVATKILAKSAPIASQKLVEILESDDPIPQVNAKLQAAQTLLDRVGISKRDKLDVNHTIASGIFIIPQKEELIDVTAEDVIDET